MRLIFHLSYPRSSKNKSSPTSINGCIPPEFCTVRYPDFDDAVKLCLQAGRFCKMAKSDMSMTFRQAPLRKTEWAILVLKAEHPITKKVFYFCDKCLPFGSSISCALFQKITDAISFLVFRKTLKKNVNYLDDFLFIAFLKWCCDMQVQEFLNICQKINLPVALEKTMWGATTLTFLGLLLNSTNQVVCIPRDKVIKALDMVTYLLNPNKRKATVLQIQQLTGYLNFLCRCVIPGRAFTRRFYAYISGSKLLPHHHVRISNEMKMDLQVW